MEYLITEIENKTEENIMSLDLSMIKLKLEDKEEGQGWEAEFCNEAEIEYKRFLILKWENPNADIVPNGVIDKFWHQHILDTEKYAQDCNRLFGKFIHHYPYFGMNGEKDAKDLKDAFEYTKELYKKKFGENYIGAAKRCKAPKCRTQCKPMKCK